MCRKTNEDPRETWHITRAFDSGGEQAVGNETSKLEIRNSKQRQKLQLKLKQSCCELPVGVARTTSHTTHHAQRGDKGLQKINEARSRGVAPWPATSTTLAPDPHHLPSSTAALSSRAPTTSPPPPSLHPRCPLGRKGPP